jgi:hypothetical protein
MGNFASLSFSKYYYYGNKSKDERKQEMCAKIKSRYLKGRPLWRPRPTSADAIKMYIKKTVFEVLTGFKQLIITSSGEHQ